MSDDPRFPERPDYDPYGRPPQARPRRGLSIFGFPLRIDPIFFISALIIGGRQETLWLVVWVLVVLVGILAHELGHAFAGRRYGLEPWIRLVAFGGMTGWRQPKPLTPGQHIVISAAGPAVGIAIGLPVLVAGLMAVQAGASPAVLHFLEMVVFVNLGWGVLNLLPILPLDGGHIAATVAGMVAGHKGRVAARIFSIVLTVTIGLWALMAGQWWIGVLGVILTFANVQGLRAEMARR